ncbi:MAG: serine hydrolase domain-containing protein [Deltaproteobacteria bacterium]
MKKLVTASILVVAVALYLNWGKIESIFVAEAGGPVRPLQTDTSVKDLSPLLERESQAQQLPAVAAVVIKGNRIISPGVTGVRKLGDSTRATLQDRWHLGSCTKPMTATLIAALVERGAMKWETTIEAALPSLAAGIRREYRNVTVEQLLAHRGGIRHEWDIPGLWDVLWKREGTPTEQRRRMAKVMLAQEPKQPIGEYFYSNCGYGIAGLMAETMTGKTWEQLMRDVVFAPLNMQSASFGVPWEGEPPTNPWPHDKEGNPIPPGRFADNPPSIGPGGTVHATIEDWAKFAFDHLKGERGEYGTLLKPETYARLHKGRAIAPGDNNYALGWNVVERPWAKGSDQGSTGRCLNHAGSNNSWYALIWVAPERDLAILCTTNIGGDGVFPKIDKVIWAVISDYISQAGP